MRKLLILALGALSFIGAARAPEARKLVIAVQPTSTPEKLSAHAAELEQFLEQRLGTDVEIKFPTQYSGVIEALRFGHAQAAFMGAWPAALAGRHAGAEVVLAEIREVSIGDRKTEAPHYLSYWVVRKDSPIQSLQELKGKKAAFPSQISTSGYVAPLAKLVEEKLISRQENAPADPKQFFGEAVFSGGYAQCWEALKAGQVDVTVIAGDVPETLYEEVLANTRVIETQGPIPSHAVVFAKDFKEPLRGKLLSALQELGQPEHRDLMRKFVSGIFVRFEPSTGEQHLETLRKQLDLTGLDFKG